MSNSNTYDNYSFDYESMKDDLRYAEAKPGQKTVSSDRYWVLPSEECAIRFRLLPPIAGSNNRKPYFETRLHYLPNKGGYHCLKEKDTDGRWKGDCPICNYYNALYRKADEAKTLEISNRIKEAARKLKPVERIYFNAIAREWFDPDTKKTLYNVGPRILAVGKSLHAKILRAYCGSERLKQAPIGDISHPLKGRDITIVKLLSSDGVNKFPSYDESRFEEPSVLGTNEEIASWLGKLWDLGAERIDNLKPYSELEALVEIVQGKRVDPSISFNPDDYDLPVGFNDDQSDPDESPRSSKPAVFESKTQHSVQTTPASSVKPAASKTQKTAPTPPSKPTPQTEDTSFDVNLDDQAGIDVDENWVKDFQRAIDEAV